MTQVYALTTIGIERDHGEGAPHHWRDVRTRTVGLFITPQTAVTFAANNYGDIYEAGWYPYAVIERIELDCLYPSINLRDGAEWMQWDDNRRGYEHIAGPPQWWTALRLSNAASIG